MLEFGLISFADMEPGAHAGQRLHDLLEEMKLADELGIDVFALGEHHRPDYAVSMPEVVLAAAAMVTKNIKLSSAVTVLSSSDPVRVFQAFSHVDLLSQGRAEIMAGRGSFTESFPLFGYPLEDYDALFEEKLELLLKLNEEPVVNWQGKLRPSIAARGVYPRPHQARIPVWLAAGGTPASAVRAAKLGLPLILAIIGGSPKHFVPFIDLYKKAALAQGISPQTLQIGINNHMFLGEDSTQVANEFYPHYAAMMNRVGSTRGWPALRREQYEWARSSEGALMVGSVQQVTEKILQEWELFGFTRFMAQASMGTVPHKLTLKSIELFGDQVIPAVRKALSK